MILGVLIFSLKQLASNVHVVCKKKYSCKIYLNDPMSDDRKVSLESSTGPPTWT